MFALGTLKLLWSRDVQGQPVSGTSAFLEPQVCSVEQHVCQALELVHEGFVDGITGSLSPKEKEKNSPEITLASANQ